MHLIHRRPDRAYYGSTLWLPKTYYAEQQLQGALSYEKNDGEVFVAYRREQHHFVVPRNFISTIAFGLMPFQVVDARIQRFPRVQVQSKVTLDYKNPEEHHQRHATTALLQSNDGILCLRCGAGKTIVSIHAFCQLHVPTLIVVNDLGLAEQWLDEVLEFTDLQEDEVGFIGAGQFNWQHKVTIALAQSLAGRVRDKRLPPELVEHFGLTIADEAHTTAGPAFYHLSVTPFHGRRWGLSATPRRHDVYDSLLRYTIGPVLYRYLVPELVPAIFFRKLPTRLNLQDTAVYKACTDRGGELHRQKIYGHLATCDDRTAMIANEIQNALAQGRQILVLSQSRAMLDALYALFPQAGLIHGGVKSRKERRRRVRECNPLIAISKLGRQALNKPVLDTLFVLEPYTDPGVLQQLLGRIQRRDPNKQSPIAVFYEDAYIKPMHLMCKRIRSILSRWPSEQGGRLGWKSVGEVAS